MPSRLEMERAIRDRAQTDPTFRAELMRDPQAAVSAALGFEIPDSLSVRVEEESASEVVLVVPGQRAGRDDVADEELEASVGGDNNTAQCETQGCVTW